MSTQSHMIHKQPDEEFQMSFGTDREVLWAVGFLEGEGSFTRGTRSIRIEAKQNEKEPLERLQAALGGGTIYLDSKRGIHQWTMFRRAEVVATLRLIWPEMSSRRKAQIWKLLYWHRLHPMTRRGPESKSCKSKGCGRKYYARGWCNTHYQRERRDGRLART